MRRLYGWELADMTAINVINSSRFVNQPIQEGGQYLVGYFLHTGGNQQDGVKRPQLEVLSL